MGRRLSTTSVAFQRSDFTILESYVNFVAFATGFPHQLRRKASEIMLNLFIAANVADAISTMHALPYGGIEGNPILAAGIHTIGLEPTLILKVVAAMAIGLLLAKRGKAHLLKWPTVVIVIAAVSNGIHPYLL